MEASGLFSLRAGMVTTDMVALLCASSMPRAAAGERIFGAADYGENLRNR
jgi:hypothetical protein